jgi:hypothetical protein
MTSLDSQLCRAAFLAVILLLLWVKGVTSQKGSPGSDDKSQKEKMPFSGRWRRGRQSLEVRVRSV